MSRRELMTKLSTEELDNYYYRYLENRKSNSDSKMAKPRITERTMAHKLIGLTLSVVNGHKHKGEFDTVSKKLGISFEQLINRVLFYTLDLGKVENKDYLNDYSMRSCMRMHALAEGSYHREKYRTVKEMMANPEIKTAIEFGFGIPGDHVFSAFDRGQKIILSDYDRKAIEFAQATLELHQADYKKNIDFRLIDLNKNRYAGDFDAYIFLDSLEHTDDPTKHLRMLADNMPKGAHLITSLPIGQIDMMSHAHNIEFLTKQDIIDWLESAGFKIIRTVEAKPNPKVDFFASLMVGGYTDLVTDAVKLYNQLSKRELSFDNSLFCHNLAILGLKNYNHPHQTSFCLTSVSLSAKYSRQTLSTFSLSYGLHEKTSIKASLYLMKVWIEMCEKSIIAKALSPGFDSMPLATIGPSKMLMSTDWASFSINSRRTFLSPIFSLQFVKSKIL